MVVILIQEIPCLSTPNTSPIQHYNVNFTTGVLERMFLEVSSEGAPLETCVSLVLEFLEDS